MMGLGLGGVEDQYQVLWEGDGKEDFNFLLLINFNLVS